MTLTSIGSQKTPGRPIETTFAADTGTPSDAQELLLIGKMINPADAASGTESGDPYTVVAINNAGDLTAATEEAEEKFGEGSELAKMVIAAVAANSGGSTFPAIKCIGLPYNATTFGPSDEALVAARGVKAEFIVSPFAGDDDTLRNKLEAHAELVSGAQRVENNQYGSFGVASVLDEDEPSDLPSPDSQYFIGIYFRDTNAEYSEGEVAAAAAAVMAANGVPFNPLDDKTINGIAAPTDLTEYLTVGAGLESETVLDKGWTPLFVKPNGEVAFVRTVTSRITVDADGVTEVGSYYDVQDFQVIYYWRKTLKTRFSQPDFKRRKASDATAREALAEMIRLATLFQDQNMFQAVDKLAKKFRVERNTSDRHRLDYKTPINVIPGLHVMAGNIEATTEFDTITL